MKKRLFLICLSILTAASSVYAKVVWNETFSTRRASTYIVQVHLANYDAWPYASQWFTGYNEGKDDVVEGNQYDNDYNNVSSYSVSIRGKKLNGDVKNTVGLFFPPNKPAEQNYVLFEGGLPTISNGGVLKLDVCATEVDNGGTLNEMIITINNGIVLNIPATTLGARSVTSTIEVNLPSVQIDSLKIAFNNAPSQRFISRMWMEDGYFVCYDGIYFYLNTVNQTAEVTANPIHYTGDITIPTHITHENVIYSVVGIGDGAFINSNNLTSITMESETPISVGNRAFEGVNCPFYVPCGSMEAYKAAWSEYASRITYSPSQTCIFNISTTSTNPEWGTTAGDTATLYLEEVEISAIPNYGYHFVRWNDGNTSNPRTVSVTEDKTFIATFAKNVYSITANAEHGSISGNSSAEYLDFVTLTVTPNYGYHFTQWSDGLKDNPRIFQITKDTTFTAEFAYDRVGTCGKDLALVWSYDPTNKVLTIGNAGSFTENMQFGAEAPGEMEELVIGNSVTAIGANAFAGIETLKKVSIGESVKTIGEQAFYNCMNLETIFNYRPTPTNTYSNAFDGVDKFECVLYVLPNSIDMYKAAAVWRDFYYANGQLTGIAFASSRDGQAHAPQAIMTANGLQFTVTGLDSNTQYGYNLTAKDANDQTIATYSGEFTTTSEGIATGIEETSSSLQGGDRGRLILHNGQIFILRGEKVYTLQGQEVK